MPANHRAPLVSPAAAPRRKQLSLHDAIIEFSISISIHSVFRISYFNKASRVLTTQLQTQYIPVTLPAIPSHTNHPRHANPTTAIPVDIDNPYPPHIPHHRPLLPALKPCKCPPRIQALPPAHPAPWRFNHCRIPVQRRQWVPQVPARAAAVRGVGGRHGRESGERDDEG